MDDVSINKPDLSQVEFGLLVASHAFDRWTVRCMAAAGLSELTATDIMVLHHVYHRHRAKKLADICFTLNIEDTHIVSYALKKLERLGVVRGDRGGKEVLYSVTPDGASHIKRYIEVREQCLIGGLESGAAVGIELSHHLAYALRALSGLYEQAARAATSL